MLERCSCEQIPLLMQKDTIHGSPWYSISVQELSKFQSGLSHSTLVMAFYRLWACEPRDHPIYKHPHSDTNPRLISTQSGARPLPSLLLLACTFTVGKRPRKDYSQERRERKPMKTPTVREFSKFHEFQFHIPEPSHWFPGSMNP